MVVCLRKNFSNHRGINISVIDSQTSFTIEREGEVYSVQINSTDSGKEKENWKERHRCLKRK